MKEKEFALYDKKNSQYVVYIGDQVVTVSGDKVPDNEVYDRIIAPAQVMAQGRPIK